jgi:hypothetical protein
VTVGGGTIDVVRGGLSEDRADRILGFWSEHGALVGEEARQRLTSSETISCGWTSGTTAPTWQLPGATRI